MTDLSPLITTTSISNPFPVTAVPADQSPQLNGALSDNAQEEEEYTIKCICSYLDDDGNTVYCPKCDTWQHIECYYPSKKVPEEHYCADCVPRDNLDAKRATERQRRRREALDGGDRKLKRPPASKTKKKHKDSISTTEQINGWHTQDRHDSLTNGRDQPPPAKKPKTSHRPSGSIASVNGDSRKRATSSAQNYPSPSKSPPEHIRYARIPLYSPEFLELYDHDEGSTVAQANVVTLPAMDLLLDWRNNPSRIAAPGQQPTNEIPFVRAPAGVDLVSNPKVTVETTQRKDLEIGGKIPRWKYVKTNGPLAKDEIVGEIRGDVGLLPEYCLQKSTQNRWNELMHPDPFVFFHPHMNIYIDSRKEGTHLKYIRRSCLANVTLKTLVSEDGDIRHCFAARHEIAAGSELTAAWFIDPEMMLSGHINGGQEEAPFSRKVEWASRVLSNFGDCACLAGAKCGFASLDRRMPLKMLEVPEKSKAGRKKRPPKGKPAASPMSTGQATNSRAGSEALKQEDEEQNDHHSTSTSTSTDAKSRDITPVTVAALDADPVLGSDLTAREIRKIKAMEKMFEQSGPGKKDNNKKKRTSAGSNLTTPNPNAKHSPHLTPGPIVADHFSGSPPPRVQRTASKGRTLQPSPPRATYESIGIQTDPEEPELEMPPAKRRKYLTPTQKLLRKVLADRTKWEQEFKRSPTSPPVQGASMATPTPAPTQIVEMTDAAAGVSPVTVGSAPASSPTPSETRHAFSPIQPPAYPLPSQAAHSLQPVKVPSAPRLQLSLLPPVPAFSAGPPLSTHSASTLSATFPTPSTSTPSTAQSPAQLVPTSGAYPGFTNAVATPSPAKKKLTLGDYISRRNTNPSSTPTSEKPTGLATSDTVRKDSTGSASGQEASAHAKASESSKEETPVKGEISSSPVEDTVMKEANEEPEYTLPEGTMEKAGASTRVPKTELPPATVPPPLSSSPSTVSNVLASLTALHEQQRRQSVESA